MTSVGTCLPLTTSGCAMIVSNIALSSTLVIEYLSIMSYGYDMLPLSPSAQRP